MGAKQASEKGPKRRVVPRPLWGPHPVPHEKDHAHGFGTVRIWIHGVRNEAKLAVETLTEAAHAATEEESLLEPQGIDPAAKPPEDLTWQRFAFPAPPEELDFVPTTPDRPLILATSTALNLRPGARVRILVALPAWVSIRGPARGEVPDVLQEVPTVTLSSTWFGIFLEGEMCYWLPTAACPDVEDVPVAPHLITCPIQIVNRSDEALHVDKICLRSIHASVFLHEGRLWTDENRINYLGGGDFSRISWSGKPPPEAAGAARLAEPREVARTGLTAWTFERLREIPGWGIR